MLLGVDIGNTHTVVGLFGPDAAPGSLPAADWRMRTAPDQTSDELAAAYAQQLALHGGSMSGVTIVIVSSVVPALTDRYRRFVARHIGCEALVVGPGLATGMRIRSDNPHEVGADRIVNAVAAWERYRGACIVVDMGTATTVDAISSEGAYLGGAIAPGLGISIDALVSHAARLASVELAVPARAIGTNTVASMQSGAVLGAIAQLEGMLARFRRELVEIDEGLEAGAPVPAIGTGGITALIGRHVAGLDDVDPQLTLRGLHLIAHRSR